METINYKGFTGSIEVSFKDKCIFGKILFINDLVTYEADSLSKLEEEFKDAVEDYLETCSDLGLEPHKSFSGTFNVRIGQELHQNIAFYAIKNDKTINTVVKKAIETYMHKSNQKTEIHNHTYNIKVEKDMKEFSPESQSFEKIGNFSLKSRTLQ